MTTLLEIGKRAKIASFAIAQADVNTKNHLLRTIGKNLLKHEQRILDANVIDIEEGRKNGLSEGLIDRLLLTSERIKGMVDGIDVVIKLEDPIDSMDGMKRLPNNLRIGKVRVSLGVVGIIYESRPNVTIETTALCLKSSNALILRGGKEAIRSNIALVEIVRESLVECGIDPHCVQLIEDQSYDVANAFMRLNEYLDVLIPRGSQRLIQSVVQNATVPIIETGVGNCHVYIDETANMEIALNIIRNAKTQRIGVCNAMESLLVHESRAEELTVKLRDFLSDYHVIVKGDDLSRSYDPLIEEATEEDWGKEYLDYCYSQKVVSSLQEAISHINEYGSGHSEVIITESYESAMSFTQQVDAACVYVNASSRFTDGFEFGMGAEMGISTQKLHARGPIGLVELTTTKYVILGQGQIRP